MATIFYHYFIPLKTPISFPVFIVFLWLIILKQRKMKAILIEQNAYEEMNQSIQDVKNELAQMKKTLRSSPKKFFTVSEVQKELAVTRATLNNWHKEGILIKKYVGGRVYYKSDEVYNLLNK